VTIKLDPGHEERGMSSCAFLTAGNAGKVQLSSSTLSLRGCAAIRCC
jgi:hypothetical protein